MFVSDKLVYLALQKTGCTHVLKMLSTTPGLNGEVIGKHNTINQISKEKLGDISKKIKAGNVRNPWDWYVSLWAYGSMDNGALYKRLASGNIFKKILQPRTLLGSSREWKKVYSSNSDPALFRQWLKMLLDANIADVGEGYGNAAVSKEMGLYSYRYLKLYTYNFGSNIKQMQTINDAIAFDKEKNFIDNFIRNENLENDLKELLLKVGISEDVINEVMNTPKTNSSVRRRYSEYYDDESKELVNKKEKLIIEKHNYKF